MSEPETIEEYIESLRPLSISHLEWMAQNIDKEKYPERYKAIVDAISDKKSRPESFEETTLPSGKPMVRIITITGRIRKLYFVFVCIGTLDTIFNLLGMSENLQKGEHWQGIINTLLYLVLYVGIRIKAKWFIPLVLIASAWLMLSTFLTSFQPALDIRGLFAKAFGILLLLFLAYQMHFFSKREVKIYFGLEGTILF
jgi:hypothetical protein